MDFTTDNIDQLRAWKLPAPGGWRITFRSTNAGMCHQLYVNGRLADWTEGTDGRTFTLPPCRSPRQVIVAAAAPHLAGADFSSSLPEDARKCQWEFRTSVMRLPELGPQAKVALVGDHATGRIDDEPLAAADAWPAGRTRWGFGEQGFGAGDMGMESAAAAGFAAGTFGGGPFGADADSIELRAPLAEAGEHRLAVRVIEPDGRVTQGPQQVFTADPPPAAVRGAAALAYDKESQLLTLQIER